MLNPTIQQCFCGLNVCITKEVDFCGFYLKKKKKFGPFYFSIRILVLSPAHFFSYI